MIKAVFFDLDGTLLPLDQDQFLDTYLKLLAAKLAPRGYEPQKLIKAIWQGSMEMIKNDGTKTNEQVFWSAFADIFGEGVRADEPYFDEYYRTDFKTVRAICGYTDASRRIVDKLRERGITAVLATNPVFPMIATETRMGWVDLVPSDFAIITTYENSRYCKPNPAYYLDLAEQLGISADECLMVGNDVDDDMIASTVGMKVFLLTDCLVNRHNKDISVYQGGNFAELEAYLDKLLS